MANETPLLRAQAVQAVRALLEVIIKAPDNYVGSTSAGPIRGTQGSFAAQAIRDLMSIPAIGEVVADELKKRNQNP